MARRKGLKNTIPVAASLVNGSFYFYSHVLEEGVKDLFKNKEA